MDGLPLLQPDRTPSQSEISAGGAAGDDSDADDDDKSHGPVNEDDFW